MPDPVDADPSSSRSQRTGDITSLLINIYGSKVRDDFWCCGITFWRRAEQLAVVFVGNFIRLWFLFFVSCCPLQQE